jgi:hypothetical protein
VARSSSSEGDASATGLPIAPCSSSHKVRNEAPGHQERAAVVMQGVLFLVPLVGVAAVCARCA